MSPRIRVLHPITRLIVGGAQENTMYTAALLDPRRYAVDVLSGSQTGSEGSLIEEVRGRGIPLTILPELVRQVSPKNDLLAVWKMRHLMLRNHYTIVHTHSSKAGILGRLAARLARVPVIVHTVHGWSFHDHMHPVVRSMYIFLERFAARFSDALVVVAEGDIAKGLQAGIGKPEDYHLIRSAIPLQDFSPQPGDRQSARDELGVPDGALVVGNLGRFSAQKNPLDWVRVAGKVGRALPEAWFLLVGDGPLRHHVEVLLHEEGIASRTCLAGLRRDTGRMLAAMDVFLLTSLWEGLPRVIPEAMAAGVPVVATRADGSAEAILPGETGFLSPPGDLDQMAQQVIQLLGDEGLRTRIARRAMEVARHEFDLQAMIAAIESLYGQLLDRKRLR